MKQASSRWLAAVMAVLVVWLGGGVSILQCMHRGLTPSPSPIGRGVVCTEGECASCATCGNSSASEHASSSCMKLLTLQLPTTTPQSTLALDLQPLPTVVFLLPTLTRLPEICARQCLAPRSHYVWHSPPRHWLHLIRVLLI